MCPLPCPRGSSSHKSFLASTSLMAGPVLPHHPLCMIQSKEAQGVCHPPGPQHHVPAGSTFHPFLCSMVGKEPQKATLRVPALPFPCSLLLSSRRSGLWTSTGTTLLPR